MPKKIVLIEIRILCIQGLTIRTVCVKIIEVIYRTKILNGLASTYVAFF